MTEKIIDKVSENGTLSIKNNSANWNIIDYKRDYSRSNVYADLAYKDNFRGNRELLARAGFIYYLK